MGAKLAMNTDSFFEKVLNKSDFDTLYMKAKQGGVEFILGFFTIEAKKGGNKIAEALLPQSVTYVMKNYPTWDSAHIVVEGKIKYFLSEVCSKVGKISPMTMKPKVIDPVPVGGKKWHEGEGNIIVDAKILQTPVDLSEAKYVGQKVKGTSHASLYTVLGVSGDMVSSFRYSASSPKSMLSFRVTDLKGAKAEVAEALKTMGFVDKGGYWSVHYLSEDITLLKKTMGSFLFLSAPDQRLSDEEIKKEAAW